MPLVRGVIATDDPNVAFKVIIFVCCRIMTWIFVGVFDAKSVNGHFSFYCCKSLETVA